MKNLYTILCCLFLSLTVVSCKKDDGGTAPTTQQATSITIDNYNRITLGMSYSQVTAILGQGTVTTSTASAKTYQWSADNTNTITIVLVFTNGSVTSRTQTGLASTGSTGGGSTGGTTTNGSCPATYNGRTVYVGPRGGCYYINSNGNKTYI